ncbi:MAG: hypothetical protein IAC69_03150 [Proteobacteria bacterium]|uniref:Uncharacterized protein n=1 Tax=Candidatus Enterousia avistercoris TaxID=2840788 RepID=A0A9D9GUD9_9PROT|nr:hypothetical protein [Candidatus Enterousia avistercoris]
MARVLFSLSLLCSAVLLSGCLETGSGTPQHNPFKDRPNYGADINITKPYADTVAKENAEITNMYSRNAAMINDWVSYKLSGSKFDVNESEYPGIIKIAQSLITASASDINSVDSDLLSPAMALLDSSMRRACASAENIGDCIVNWRENNAIQFATSANTLMNYTTELTVDNATLTATNGYQMKFTIDPDTGEIDGMTLTRDSGDVDLAKLGDSSTFYGSDIENGRVLELDYVSDAKQMGLSYSDFGLINIQSSMDSDHQVDAWLVPFAGGYDDKKIAVADIDSDMTFRGRAVGTATKGEDSINLGGTATLNFKTGDTPTSELAANFDNWYNVTITQNGDAPNANFVFSGNPTETDVILTNTTGTGTMNVGYYGPAGSPTEATGLVHYQETDVENPVSLDMAFGVK